MFIRWKNNTVSRMKVGQENERNYKAKDEVGNVGKAVEPHGHCNV